MERNVTTESVCAYTSGNRKSRDSPKIRSIFKKENNKCKNYSNQLDMKKMIGAGHKTEFKPLTSENYRADIIINFAFVAMTKAKRIFKLKLIYA